MYGNAEEMISFHDEATGVGWMVEKEPDGTFSWCVVEKREILDEGIAASAASAETAARAAFEPINADYADEDNGGPCGSFRPHTADPRTCMTCGWALSSHESAQAARQAYVEGYRDGIDGR